MLDKKERLIIYFDFYESTVTKLSSKNKKVGKEDINIYNVSCQKELSQLQSIIVLESTDTKKQINQLINSSNAIGIANSGSETFMIPVSIISPGTIVLSNKKKSILLKATV